MVVDTGSRWFQFVAAISSSILAIGQGLQMGWPAPSVLKMQDGDIGFPISEDEISTIVMVAPFGYLIGSPLGAFLLDKIGRKYTLLLTAIPQIVNWLLVANATNIQTLVIARIISGVADGATFTVLPIYMGEVTEPKIRGKVSSSFSIGIISGILFINSYGAYLPIKTAAYCSLMVPLLFLCTFAWMPKTPYYLLIKHKVDEARDSLKRLRRRKDVEDELSSIHAAVTRQIAEPGRFRDVFFVDSNRKAFLIVLGLRTAQQFSGLTAVGFYLPYIFKQAGGKLTAAESTIICCAIQIPCTCLSSAFVDRFGRKPLFIIANIGSSITLSILGIYFYFHVNGYDVSSVSWLPITGMILYNIIICAGLFTIPSIFAGEILSAKLKSKTSALINCYFGLCISAATIVFQLLNKNFGIYAPFITYAICCATSAVFCYLLVPETKGRTLEEIQLMLKGKPTAVEMTKIQGEKLLSNEKV